MVNNGNTSNFSKSSDFSSKSANSPSRLTGMSILEKIIPGNGLDMGIGSLKVTRETIFIIVIYTLVWLMFWYGSIGLFKYFALDSEFDKALLFLGLACGVIAIAFHLK